MADTCARGDVGANTYPLAGRTTCSAAQASWEMVRPPSSCRPLGLGIHLLRSSACTQRYQQSGNSPAAQMVFKHCRQTTVIR